MKTEILVSVITGSVSILGIVTAARIRRNLKPSDTKKKRNTGLMLIIFCFFFFGSAVYFFITHNDFSKVNIVWKTDNAGYFTDQRDQHKYKVIKIGNQIWMAENLAYKKDKGCWAYDNNPSNVEKYGYLYDWQTANKVTPKGWHLPTCDEFSVLFENYEGGGSQLFIKGEETFNALKKGGNSNFNMICAGRGNPSDKFSGEGIFAGLWSATVVNANEIEAWCCNLFSKSEQATLTVGRKNIGLSVRLLLDADITKKYLKNNDENAIKTKKDTVFTLGTFKDNRDGKVYKTVQIGDQTWMTENLAFKVDSGCYAYDNDENNNSKYGYLYSIETAKKVAPEGWHLPTKADYFKLLNNFGGNENEETYNALLKKGKSNFDVIFGGYYYDGNLKGKGESAFFWTSTIWQGEAVYILNFSSEKKNVFINVTEEKYMYSIRLVKDN